MPHRICHILDSTIVTSIVAVATGTGVLLTTDPSSQQDEMRLLLLPLIGAMIASGAMIMLNPQPETRRIVIGRSMLALFFGTVGPSLLSMVHPGMANLALRPAALLALGCIFSTLAYVLSKPFTRELYARADRVAKTEADRLEQKYAPPLETKVVTITETHPVTTGKVDS